MNKVIDSLTGCAAYSDDIVVFSDTWDSRIKCLNAMYDWLVEANLIVNLAKCKFAKATVTYLGKVIGQGEVYPGLWG